METNNKYLHGMNETSTEINIVEYLFSIDLFGQLLWLYRLSFIEPIDGFE